MRNFIYNLISLLGVVGTIVVIIGTAVLVITPTEEERALANTLPTAVAFPTDLPTATPTITNTPGPPTFPPTFTPTPTFTFTPSPTFTETPTITLSPTITSTPRDTDTPTVTYTPSASPTVTPSPTPTGPSPTFSPSPNPFPFLLREDIAFAPNSFNTLGCNWQGVGGQVVDVNGNPFTSSLQVHVFDAEGTIDRIVRVGSSTLVNSQASWEVTVDNKVNNRTYFVELQTTIGTTVSVTYNFTFPQDCNRNAAIVNFRQNPIFGG
jgi:hypothetical protein